MGGRSDSAGRPQHALTLWQKVIVVAGAAALLWFVFVVTVGGVLSARLPDVVLKLAPFDARAQGRAAFFALQKDRKPSSLRRAKELGNRALRRDPTNIDALRALGIVAGLQRDQAGSLRLFRYAHSLSRRDLATQLWLIEFFAQTGSVSGALQHFDIALRTSRGAARILFPILINASDDPEISAPLNKLLQQRPYWWRSFIPELLVHSKSPDTIVRVTQDVLDPRVEEDRALIRQMLDRLVAVQGYEQAWKVYENAAARSGRRVDRAAIADGGFDESSPFTPFGWSLVEDADLSAVRQGSDGNVALYLSARNGRGGDVARQLLLLPAGRYRLSGLVGNVSGPALDRPAIIMSCARSQREILKLPLPAAGEAGTGFATQVSVPAGCSAQWLSIRLRSTAGTEGVWVDSLALSRS